MWGSPPSLYPDPWAFVSWPWDVGRTNATRSFCCQMCKYWARCQGCAWPGHSGSGHFQHSPWPHCPHFCKDTCVLIRPTSPTPATVQFSHSVMSDPLWPRGLQHTRPPCPSPTPGVYSNSCPLSRWCHWTVASSVIPFSSAFNLSQHQGLFRWLSSLHQVAKVLEFQLQHQSFQWIFMTDFL